MMQHQIARTCLPIGGVVAVAMLAASVTGTARQEGGPQTRTGDRGVMLMNRIGLSSSELHIARADGTDERKLFAESTVDLHASYSPDGGWIVFTSERNGLGQADIYRAKPDDTHVERLTDSPALDDQGALSPDGTTKEEAALYDRTVQPYGQIVVMNADGSGKRQLTDSLWEDSMPRYVPTAKKTN